MKIRGTKMQSPKQWERKDNFEHIFLNRYGYYELRVKNVQEERKNGANSGDLAYAGRYGI